MDQLGDENGHVWRYVYPQFPHVCALCFVKADDEQARHSCDRAVEVRWGSPAKVTGTGPGGLRWLVRRLL